MNWAKAIENLGSALMVLAGFYLILWMFAAGFLTEDDRDSPQAFWHMGRYILYLGVPGFLIQMFGSGLGEKKK